MKETGSTLRMITTLLLLLITIANIVIVVDAAEQQETTKQRRELKVGDTICTVGYVMDSFCIDRGTLLDNPSVKTLGPQGPMEHSVHCLVDVSVCVDSPFEILQKVGGGADDAFAFGRSFRVENNDLLVEFARTVGQCYQGCTGDLVKGLQVAVTGEILNLGQDNKIPALIRVKEVGNHLVGCEGTNDGNGDKNDVITDFEVPNMVMNSGDDTSALSSSHTRVFIIHGCLMLIAWGLLLPAGAITAKYFKHRPDNIWFHIHKKCQMIGLVIGIIGWILISNYSVALSHRGSSTLNHRHAILGTLTMIMGCLQPLNALFRPGKQNSEESISTTRRLWELMHKGLGWVSLLLAAITISFGTKLLPTSTMKIAFYISSVIISGGLLLMLIIFVFDEKRRKGKEVLTNADSSDEEDDV